VLYHLFALAEIQAETPTISTKVGKSCRWDLVFYLIDQRGIGNSKVFPFFNEKLFCKQNYINKKLCFLFGEKNYKEWLLVT